MPHLEQSQGKCLTHLLEQKLETSRGSLRDPNLNVKRPRVRQDRTIFRRVALLDFLLTRAPMLYRDRPGSSNMMLSAPLLLETPWAWLNVTTSSSKNTGLLKKKKKKNDPPSIPVPSATSVEWNIHSCSCGFWSTSHRFALGIWGELWSCEGCNIYISTWINTREFLRAPECWICMM